jgi:ribosome maturation factor RimP
MPDEIVEKVEKLIEVPLKEIGLEVAGVEYRREAVGMVLRVYIEKALFMGQNVSLDDCGKASDKIGFILDKEDAVQGHYTLEISSPGIYRRLKKEKDFVRFAGERVKLKLFNPIPIGAEYGGPVQRKLTGILKGFENGKILIEVAYDDSKIMYEIDPLNVANANLEPEVEI